MPNRYPLLFAVIAAVFTAGAQNAKTPVPPTLPCGSVTENGLVIATSDVPSSFPDKRYQSVAPNTLAEGMTALPALASDYPYNGDGHAKLYNVSAQCQPNSIGVTNAALQIDITASLWAKAGHCCGGFNPGGVVNFSPVWTSIFTFPGTDTWKIQLKYYVVKSGVNPRCQWSIDGNQQFQLSLSTNSTVQALGIKPGTHVMSVACTANDYHVDARPGNGGWNHQVSATDSIQLNWTVIENQ